MAKFLSFLRYLTIEQLALFKPLGFVYRLGKFNDMIDEARETDPKLLNLFRSIHVFISCIGVSTALFPTILSSNLPLVQHFDFLHMLGFRRQFYYAFVTFFISGPFFYHKLYMNGNLHTRAYIDSVLRNEPKLLYHWRFIYKGKLVTEYLQGKLKYVLLPFELLLVCIGK